MCAGVAVKRLIVVWEDSGQTWHSSTSCCMTARQRTARWASRAYSGESAGGTGPPKAPQSDRPPGSPVSACAAASSLSRQLLSPMTHALRYCMPRKINCSLGHYIESAHDACKVIVCEVSTNHLRYTMLKIPVLLPQFWGKTCICERNIPRVTDAPKGQGKEARRAHVRSAERTSAFLGTRLSARFTCRLTSTVRARSEITPGGPSRTTRHRYESPACANIS